MENKIIRPFPLGKLSKRDEEFLFYYVENSALSVGGEIETIIGRLSTYDLIEDSSSGPSAVVKDYERTLRGDAYVYSCLALDIKPGVATNMFSNYELDYVRARWNELFNKACEDLKKRERPDRTDHKKNTKYHSNFDPPL